MQSNLLPHEARFVFSMQVAILTANSESLHPMLDEIAEACGVSISDKRYIIVGCEKVPGFEAVALGEKVDTIKVQPGIVALVKKTLVENPSMSRPQNSLAPIQTLRGSRI